MWRTESNLQLCTHNNECLLANKMTLMKFARKLNTTDNFYCLFSIVKNKNVYHKIEEVLLRLSKGNGRVTSAKLERYLWWKIPPMQDFVLFCFFHMRIFFSWLCNTYFFLLRWYFSEKVFAGNDVMIASGFYLVISLLFSRSEEEGWK